MQVLAGSKCRKCRRKIITDKQQISSTVSKSALLFQKQEVDIVQCTCGEIYWIQK